MKKLYFFLIVLFLSTTAFSSLCAQSMKIYDVDASNYPDIKARFKLFDKNSVEVRNLNINDFSVSENFVHRDIKSVSCGEQFDKGMFSVIFLIDRSVSMRTAVDSINPGKPAKWEIANEAARTIINSLSADSSEFALLAFSFNAKLMHDFTNDKRDVIDSLDKIIHMGSADYNAAFLSDQAGNRNGAVYLAEKAKYKPIIILITDGLSVDQYSGAEFRFYDVLDSAKRVNASIYTLNLDSQSNDMIEYVSDSTRGKWYIATTLEAARLTCSKIIADAQSKTFYPPCEIIWTTDCSGDSATIKSVRQDAEVIRDITYSVPESVKPFLDVIPRDLFFVNVARGNYQDIDIKLKARQNFIQVNGINCPDSRFQVINWNGQPAPFVLDKDAERTITVRYTATDSSSTSAVFDIFSSACDGNYFNVSASWFIIKDIYAGSTPVGSAKSQTFDVVNNFGSDVSVDSVYIKDLNESDFSILSHFTKFDVKNGDTARIDLQFNPNEVGYRESNVYIVTDKGTFSSRVSGNALEAVGVDELTSYSGIIGITPNPAGSGLVEVKFEIPDASPAQVRLTDNLGNVVLLISAKDYPSGQNRIMIDADKLPSGVYYLAIQTRSQVYTGRISIIK